MSRCRNNTTKARVTVGGEETDCGPSIRKGRKRCSVCGTLRGEVKAMRQILRSWPAWLLFLSSFAWAAAADQGASRVREFAELFLAARYDALAERMSAEMREAFTPAAAAEARAAILSGHGAVQSIGETWMEDAPAGYRRFRVPVMLEQGPVDLRIVLDAEGKVAGFFYVPHVPPPGAAKPPETGAADFSGHWEGTIDLPGAALVVAVDLGRDGEGPWYGSFDSPMQGARGLPLAAVRVEGQQITFGLVNVPGEPTFEGRLEQGRIRGTFSQAGQSFPFTLGREKPPPPARPQEPKPPFPYESREVTYESGELTLSGTLTLPHGTGPFPAALLLTGSGAQNRDEELLGHRPFLVLADHLTRAGIAVLRTDDRGVGGSGGSLAGATVDELATDALAGVKFLGSVQEVDKKKIGLIGHSEGGITAPLAASRSEDVAFVVMLAGPGVPGDQILARQLELISRAAGMDEERLARVLVEQRKLLDLVAQGAAEAQLRAQLARLVEAETGAAAASSEVQPGLAEIGSRSFRKALSHDPRVALRKVRVPVLVLSGALDLQVEPEQNLPAIEKALEEAENQDVTLRKLPGLNHLFQQAKTGSPGEYASIEETMSPVALEAVTEWIVKRFASAPEPAERP